MTGKTEWKLVDDEYDFHQEIARSGYADMLHDHDRNRKYYQAITTVIKRLKNENKIVNVLDIGTGSGILSMMASRAGADSITACEAFLPMARCAANIFMDNRVRNVNLVPKRSTELIIGLDMAERANVLVAELVDTELIGEAALNTYAHAIRNLLTPDATMVPWAAELMVQVLNCPFLWSHHRILKQTSAGDFAFEPFEATAFQTCPGAPSVFDLQASQLVDVTESSGSSPPRDLIGRQMRRLLSDPVCIKRFNFGPPVENISFAESSVVACSVDGNPICVTRPGPADAFVVWWRLKMESSGIVPDISTAPSWAMDSDSAWRDHWMQAVYFPSQRNFFVKDQPLSIRFCHDSLSIWLDIGSTEHNRNPDLALAQTPERPFCQCGMHLAWSRPRIAQLNSSHYQISTDRIIERLVEDIVTSPSDSPLLVLFVSDSSTLPLKLSSVLNCRSPKHESLYLIHLDTSPYSARFLRQLYETSMASVSGHRLKLVESNDELIALLKKLTGGKFLGNVLIAAEPYVSAAMLPWEALSFWFTFIECNRVLSNSINLRLVCPHMLAVRAVLIELADLWKIRSPVGANCEGFDLRSFDTLIFEASVRVDAAVEPQPLWEYPGIARSEVMLVCCIDFSRASTLDSTFCPIDALRKCVVHNGTVISPHVSQSSTNVNAIALWTDWGIQESGVLLDFSGPKSPIVPGELINWNDTGVQQGVHIFPPEWLKGISSTSRISIKVDFDKSTQRQSFDIRLLEESEDKS